MSIFDNLLATAMMGEGGGGGGSSDFSTAEVTITNTKEESSMSVTCVRIENDALTADGFVDYETKTFTIVLYKGSQLIYLDAETITSTEGSVTGSLEDGFTVTGNCTIVGEGFGMQ